MSALPSVEASSTMITSRSANVWAAIEPRVSARSSSLLKNATTTLILGVVTACFSCVNAGRGSWSGGRGFPAESHWIVHALHVNLVPEREHDQQPHLPPGHPGILGAETVQDVQRGVLVQPLPGLRRADNLLGETIHAAAQPVPEWHRKTQLGTFSRGLGQQLGDGLAERELGGARGGLL